MALVVILSHDFVFTIVSFCFVLLLMMLGFFSVSFLKRLINRDLSMGKTSLSARVCCEEVSWEGRKRVSG